MKAKLATLTAPDRNEIARKMREKYEKPVRFYRQFLGTDMHYHLGHFPTDGLSVNDGMRNAVDGLLALAGILPQHPRVLDVGCGWGGPAKQLITKLDASVECVTVSARQARFTHRRLRQYNVTVHALDVEDCPLPRTGLFDVIWMYESLEHMVAPGRVLQMLRSCVSTNGKLLIATSCSGEEAPAPLYSTRLGVQPLSKVWQLENLLLENGWQTERLIDRTPLTLPGWEKWRSELRQMMDPKFKHAAEDLMSEFGLAEALYTANLLRSIQVVAFPREKAGIV